MANIQRGNLFYIDATTPKLNGVNTKVLGIVVTATSANAILSLKDASLSGTVMTLDVAGSGTSQFFDFSNCPLVFPTGIEASTVTNCVATVIIQAGNG